MTILPWPYGQQQYNDDIIKLDDFQKNNMPKYIMEILISMHTERILSRLSERLSSMEELLTDGAVDVLGDKGDFDVRLLPENSIFIATYIKNLINTFSNT